MSSANTSNDATGAANMATDNVNSINSSASHADVAAEEAARIGGNVAGSTNEANVGETAMSAANIDAVATDTTNVSTSAIGTNGIGVAGWIASAATFRYDHIMPSGMSVDELLRRYITRILIASPASSAGGSSQDAGPAQQPRVYLAAIDVLRVQLLDVELLMLDRFENPAHYNAELLVHDGIDSAARGEVSSDHGINEGIDGLEHGVASIDLASNGYSISGGVNDAGEADEV